MIFFINFWILLKLKEHNPQLCFPKTNKQKLPSHITLWTPQNPTEQITSTNHWNTTKTCFSLFYQFLFLPITSNKKCGIFQSFLWSSFYRSSNQRFSLFCYSFLVAQFFSGFSFFVSLFFFFRKFSESLPHNNSCSCFELINMRIWVE